jgi:death-on-curing protein
MRNITLQDVEESAFVLAQEHPAFDEPIPDFSTRFPNVLESCIAMPFMKYDGKYLYQRLSGKAAALLYLLIKNHPFQNGNKRIAIMTTLVYLAYNGKWLDVENTEFYKMTIWVAESLPVVKNATIKGIEVFLEKHFVKFSERAGNGP